MALTEERKKEMKEIADYVISEVNRAFERASKSTNDCLTARIPQACKGYEFNLSSKNSVANLTIRLPAYYAHQLAQNYQKKPKAHDPMFG